MVTYQRIVSKRRVVVEGVDLPDGTHVNVEIAPLPDLEAELTEEQNAAIEESERDGRAGRYWTGEAAFAAIRSAFSGEAPPPYSSRPRTRRKAVASKPRKRAKPARARSH